MCVVDKPKFLCDSTMLADINTYDFNITCIVRAQPPISHANFFYEEVPDAVTNISMTNNTYYDHHRAFMLEGVNTSVVEESCFVVL